MALVSGRTVLYAGVLLAATAGALLVLLAGGRPAARPRPLTPVPAVRSPSVHESAPRLGLPGPGPAPPSSAQAAPESAPSETARPLPRADEPAAEIVRALLPVIARHNRIEQALAEARGGRLDPVDLESRLRELVRDDPLAGTALLEALLAERDQALALKLAQVLGGLLDDPALRAATVRELAAAPARVREVGLLALLGRGEPEVSALLQEAFLHDPPQARATAAFVLNHAPAAGGRRLPVQVLEAARAALRDPLGTPARLREEALGLLGRPGATEEDLWLLEQALLQGPEPTVKGRAFRALIATGVPIGRIRGTLERALRDPALPEAIREAIRATLLAAAQGG
ncbi:MAG: hypothetical protein KatS3mg102_2526 [Planctomycetota bacterium]|nr:MAG: hypothetical protein KatS3mg102_2526 [Planctomycetota bacterium]